MCFCSDKFFIQLFSLDLLHPTLLVSSVVQATVHTLASVGPAVFT